MSSAPKSPNLREGESVLVVVCPICAAPRGVKCARERHALDGITHNDRIAAAAAWHTLNAAARRAEGRRAEETSSARCESTAKSAPRADGVEALAEEWEGFASRIRLDLDRCPPEDRDVQEARAQVWLAAAQDLRRAAADGDATECPRCGREVLAPATLAAQADAVRGAIEGAVALGLTRPGDALALFIDGKGDRETLSAIANLAREAGREGDFRYFDLRRPEESHSYSPLLNGTANEQVDKIMAALRWDNEFYRAQSKAALLRVLRSLKATGLAYSLDDVLAPLSDLAALRALADAVQDVDRRAELEHIAGRWKDHQVETSGMRSQLEALLMTDFGELLKAPQPTLDLAEAYQAGAIVYFALPVARFPETAPLVAKLIISDVNSVAGMVQDGQLGRGFASIVIDEFAAFAMPLFVDLLNKGRSARMAITISHQSMRGARRRRAGLRRPGRTTRRTRSGARRSGSTRRATSRSKRTIRSASGPRRPGGTPSPWTCRCASDARRDLARADRRRPSTSPTGGPGSPRSAAASAVDAALARFAGRGPVHHSARGRRETKPPRAAGSEGWEESAPTAPSRDSFSS